MQFKILKEYDNTKYFILSLLITSGYIWIRVGYQIDVSCTSDIVNRLSLKSNQRQISPWNITAL